MRGGRFCAALLAFAAFLGGGVLTATYEAAPPAAAQETSAFSAENLQKMREFSEVFQLVKDNYVEEISDEALMEHAIRGMIQGLDPHSAYFTAEHLEAFSKSIRAEEYGGLGIYVGERNGWIEVISPIDGTPAARAGLRAGDIIVKIGEVSTQDIGIDKAVEMMRGKVGKLIVLEVLSPDERQARTVQLRREKIVAPTVLGALAEPNYGYIRLNRFQQETVDDTVKVINKLYEENGAPLHGIILDLRNNPGGLLDSSVGVGSIFLPDGVTVVSDRGRGEENHLTASGRRHPGIKNEEAVKSVRLAVLVNNGSASASEIVAGALQDHKRAVIIGRRTYGKASVQSLLRPNSTKQKTAVKLTTARYFTPFGRSIQAVGIAPDIEVFAAKSVEAEEDSFRLSEKDLPRHLENTQEGEESEQESEETDAPDNTAEEDKAAPFIPQNDHQYDQALVVLKALAIAGK